MLTVIKQRKKKMQGETKGFRPTLFRCYTQLESAAPGVQVKQRFMRTVLNKYS